MSESEDDFESADEGSREDDDGWEIENDFNLPDVISTKSSVLPDLSSIKLNESKQNDAKQSDQSITSDAVPTSSSRLNSAVVYDGKSFRTSVPKPSETVEHETKPNSAQSNVSAK